MWQGANITCHQRNGVKPRRATASRRAGRLSRHPDNKRQQVLLKLRRKGRTLLRCWCGCKLGQPLWAVWGLLRTLRAELASTPLLGIYLKETKAQTQKHACVPMCTAALFIEAKMQQQPECPSTVNKAPHTRHTHTHTHTHEYYSAINKKGILPSVTTGCTFRALR